MKRNIVLVLGIILVVLSVVGFVLRTRFASEKSGLLIDTNPRSTVFIDNKEVGSTPYQQQRAAGEITIRLVPQEGQFSPWMTKLSLTSGIETVVKRDFGSSDYESSGEVLSYEETSRSSPSLTIVSSPDASQVQIDGEVKGFTPLPIENLSQGDHKIIVSQPGFLDREISVKTRDGYKLTVVATLAKSSQQQALSETIASPEAQTKEAREKVEILKTPTGFLRVRANPSTSSTEEGKVKPGEEYPFLEEKTGWYKIEFEKGKEGWVLGEYAKKVTP